MHKNTVIPRENVKSTSTSIQFYKGCIFLMLMNIPSLVIFIAYHHTETLISTVYKFTSKCYIHNYTINSIEDNLNQLWH